MTVIEALQLALSKPGTKVRPKGQDYFHFEADFIEPVSVYAIVKRSNTGQYLRLDIHAGSIVNSDASPVEWEVFNA